MEYSRDTLKYSFGQIAERYDEIRPPYPPDIITTALRRVAKSAPLNILEIGCGTGRATRMFAERGHHVLAIDISPELVAVAARQLADLPNVRLEVCAFEDLAVPEGAFDLVISAQAFHWIDATTGLAQVYRLLAPGGAVALFWNFLHYDSTPILRQLRNTCVARVPLFAGWPDAGTARLLAFANQWRASVGAVPGLDLVFETIVPSLRSYSHEQFLTLLSTYSWFLTQPETVRESLMADLRDWITSASEPLLVPLRTLLISAVKPPIPQSE